MRGAGHLVRGPGYVALRPCRFGMGSVTPPKKFCLRNFFRTSIVHFMYFLRAVIIKDIQLV